MSDRLCLTEDELADLIGSPQPSKQMQWLQDNGWPFTKNVAGRPRVAREYFRARLVHNERSTKNTPIDLKQQLEPAFDNLPQFASPTGEKKAGLRKGNRASN